MNAALRLICSNHPHLFKFIDRLRLHELSKSIDMFEAVKSNGLLERLHRRRVLKIKQRNAKIEELTGNLKEGSLTPGGFLEHMADADILPITGVIINYFVRVI